MNAIEVIYWKNPLFCLFLQGIFFNFNQTNFYNARDIKLHQRKQTAFRK